MQRFTFSLSDPASLHVRAEADRVAGGNVSRFMEGLVERSMREAERRREVLKQVAGKLTEEEREVLRMDLEVAS